MRKIQPLKLKVVSLKEKEIYESPAPQISSANQPLVHKTKFLNRFRQDFEKEPRENDPYAKILHRETDKLLSKIKEMSGTTAETVQSGPNSPQGHLQLLDVPISKFKPEDSLIKLEQSMGDIDSVYCTNYSNGKVRPPPLSLGTDKDSMKVQTILEDSLEGDSPGRQEAFLFQLYAKSSSPKEEGAHNNLQDMSPRCSLDYQIARRFMNSQTSSEFTGSISPGLRVQASIENPKFASKMRSKEPKKTGLLRLRTVKEIEEGKICPNFEDDSYSSGSNSDT